MFVTEKKIEIQVYFFGTDELENNYWVVIKCACILKRLESFCQLVSIHSGF